MSNRESDGAEHTAHTAHGAFSLMGLSIGFGVLLIVMGTLYKLGGSEELAKDMAIVAAILIGWPFALVAVGATVSKLTGGNAND